MCGILGRFAPHGALGDVDALCAATNLLAHRGPDDGTWWSEDAFFLGHRRLAIIDLEAGGQPMATPDGRYVIVFNGEIYNFVEVRQRLVAEGVPFQTRSDTEVILLGYVHWGPSVARELSGMFAFGIVDRAAGTLYVARDRFGEKPLFVHEAGGTVSFASELHALAALPDVQRSVDSAALGEYLCLNYIPGKRSLLRGVERLPPGTWRLYGRDGVREETYWSPAEQASPAQAAIDRDEALSRLRTLLDDAIRIALRSDVPVALFLSGGIDSSIIAESAVRQGRLRHAYCLDFDESGFGEWTNARSVANGLGIELRRAVLSAAALDDFLSIVEHADDPLGDSSAVAVWALSREAARDYKVVISGDGGDELFGGYLTYKATRYHRALSSVVPPRLRDALAHIASRLPASAGKVTPSYKLRRFLRAANLPSGEAHFTWNGSWLPAEAARLLRNSDDAQCAASSIAKLAERHRLNHAPTLGQLQRADVTDFLPNDILTKVDRMTMAHGLESRAPFLVPGVAEFALALPDALKLRAFGQPKRILRDLATKLYGSGIGRARKQGFSIPIHRWLRGPARSLAEDLLSRRAIDALGMLDTDAVLRAKDAHMANRSQLGFELWGLMVLVAWHRARIQTVTRADTGVGELRRVAIPLTTAAPLAVQGSIRET
jgi:asparagine synthase (glutamine-hydrolysing)